MKKNALSLLAATCLAPVTAAQTVLWTQNVDRTTILPGLSRAFDFGCGPRATSGGCASAPTANNIFWRRFNRAGPAPVMGTPPVNGGFEIVQVNFAIDCAFSNSGSTSVRINVFDDSNGPPFLNPGLLGYQDVVIPNMGLGIQSVPICPPIFVPESAQFVAIAIEPTPSLPMQNRFFLGANMAGEVGTTHLSASDCGVTTPPMPPIPFTSFPNSPDVILEFVSRQPVGQTTWTQSFDSQTIAPGRDVACINPMTMEVTQNSYWRLYRRSAPAAPFAGSPFPALSNCPVTGAFEITEVTFGVLRSQTVGMGGMRSGRVNFYRDLDGGPVPGPLSALQLIGGQDFMVSDTMSPVLQTVPLNPPILVQDSTPVVAVEVVFDQGGQFSIGYNGAGETPADSSYISAPACGMDDPVTFSSIGFTNSHMVLDFVSRPMAVGTPCVVPLSDPTLPVGCESEIIFPATNCGYALDMPLRIPQFSGGAATGDELVFEVVLRSVTNVVETCGGNLDPVNGIRSTFDAVMDLHVTVEGTGPAAGQIDRTISLPVTGAVIDSAARPPGTVDFATEVVSIVAEITPGNLDRDFMCLRIELGTGLSLPPPPCPALTMPSTPTMSTGDAHLLAPPCVGTVGIGEVRMSGWRTANESMGHSPLQGSTSDPMGAPVQTVNETLPPPVPNPGELAFCEANQVPNSTGQVSRIRAVGNGSITVPNLRVVAENMPAQSVFFIVSPQIGFVAQPGVSVGNICLSASSAFPGLFPGRYNSGGQIGMGPSHSLDVWSTGIPTTSDPGGGLMNLMPTAGVTFYWQAWHRDFDPPANPPPMPNTANFTNVVGVTFYM